MTRAQALTWLPFLAVLCCTGAASAADPRVPPIEDADLPTAGTCAPIERDQVTLVGNGPRTDLKWFSVSGIPRAVEFRELVPILKTRAGAERPSRHAVWITASKEHVWAHAMWVVQACAAAGIYRVGLRVRSEATGEVMGFPLFLPSARSARTDATKAGRMEVRIKMVPEAQTRGASDVAHVYAAARRALERRPQMGFQEVVADLWIPNNTPLQYAVHALDYLYRGGCAGVRLRGGVRIPNTFFKIVPKIEIQGGKVSGLPQIERPPAVAPRTEPWPLDGAAKPGWVDWNTTDLPALGELSGAASRTPEDAPVNYAAAQSGVPAEVRRGVDAQARGWARQLGSDMLDGLRGGKGFERRFASRLRLWQDLLPVMIEPARRAFPDATAVVPSTLAFNALLFGRGRALGRADVTVLLSGEQIEIISGAWRDVGGGREVTLPPLLVDPFARKDPGAFRVWFEAAFDAARRLGTRGLPLATEAEVLRWFPAAAHESVRRSLAARGPALDALAGRLGSSGYDRLVLSVQRGTATVLAGGRVVGVLSFSLTAEDAELRLDDLKPRRAP